MNMLKTLLFVIGCAVCDFTAFASADAAATIVSKGFSVADYEQSLRTGSQMTPIDIAVLDDVRGRNDLTSGFSRDHDVISPSVIGGSDANRGQFETFTLVFITDSRERIIGICGGTLIATDRVLTAAHCAQDTFCYLGSTRFQTPLQLAVLSAFQQSRFTQITTQQTVMPT